MNTPAHVVVCLAALGGGARRRHARAIAAGALLPDLPMFGFYIWQRLWIGLPETAIWHEAYFQDAWQDLFDLFNSIPIAAALGLAARSARRDGAALFFAAMLLHQLVDLPLHVDDAHRHFYPFADWRFASPVSYWDPAHNGALGSGLELAAVLVSCAVLWQRTGARAARASLVALVLVEAAGFAALRALG